MKPSALALAAVLTASPALAGGWEEAGFVDLSARVIDEGGFRVSNCHLEQSNMGGLKAVPKCYVLNTSGKPGTVRVEFTVLNAEGAPVISTTLTPFTLADMNGSEVSQFVPVTAAEWGDVKRARVRVTKP